MPSPDWPSGPNARRRGCGGPNPPVHSLNVCDGMWLSGWPRNALARNRQACAAETSASLGACTYSGRPGVARVAREQTSSVWARASHSASERFGGGDAVPGGGPGRASRWKQRSGVQRPTSRSSGYFRTPFPSLARKPCPARHERPDRGLDVATGQRLDQRAFLRCGWSASRTAFWAPHRRNGASVGRTPPDQAGAPGPRLTPVADRAVRRGSTLAERSNRLGTWRTSTSAESPDRERLGLGIR